MKKLLAIILLACSLGATANDDAFKLKYNDTKYYSATYAVAVCAEKGYFELEYAKTFLARVFSKESLARIQSNIDKSAYDGCKSMVKPYELDLVRTPAQAAEIKAAEIKAAEIKRNAAIAQEEAVKAERKAKQEAITTRELEYYRKLLANLENSLADESRNIITDIKSIKTQRDVAKADMNRAYVKKDYKTIRFQIVQRLDYRMIEAKTASGELFLIIDNGIFTSTGWTTQDMIRMDNHTVEMNNGFTRESALFMHAPEAAVVHRAKLEKNGYYAAKNRYDSLDFRIAKHTDTERDANRLLKKIASVKAEIAKREKN